MYRYKLYRIFLEKSLTLLKMFSLVNIVILRAEFVKDYLVLEEQDESIPVGNVLFDFGLDLKYDASILNELRFSFLTSPDRNDPLQYFSIDKKTGIIQTKNRIDRESICQQSHPCFLKMDVAVQPIKYFNILKIRAEIVDVNDNVPRFPASQISQTISESADVGTGFPIPTATDADGAPNGVRTYELIPALSKFELTVRNLADGGGSMELRVVLKEKLDRETVSSYRAIVYAIDGGVPPKTGSVIIDIVVSDVNDNRPEFLRRIYEVWIPENSPRATVVVTVKATDPDEGLNGKVVYQLSARSHEFIYTFSVGRESGEISLTGMLDYEFANIYALSLAASDEGVDGAVTYTTVVIHVDDVNDNAPQLAINTLSRTTGRSEVKENSPFGTFIAHLSVMDRDSGYNGKVSCKLSDVTFALSHISNTEYKVVTSAAIDRESRDRYEIYVTCVDQGFPPLESLVNFSVSVLDENDNAPYFIHESYSANVNESTNFNDILLQVLAVDKDIGENGKIMYRLDGSESNNFQIDQTLGKITFNSAIDRTMVATHSKFQVVAEDGGNPRKSQHVTIVINFSHTHHSRLNLTKDHMRFTVLENCPIGTVVGSSSRNDIHLTRESCAYALKLMENSVPTAFLVDSISGIISIRSSIDREVRPYYHVTVMVYCSGDQWPEVPQKVTAVSITVIVQDQNDNKPSFTFPTNRADRKIIVSRETPIGQTVTRFEASDPDIDARMTFQLEKGHPENAHRAELFALDSHTGALTIQGDLRYVDQDNITLRAVVRDLDDNRLYDSVELTVVVVPRSDIRTASRNEAISMLASQNLLIALATCLCAVIVIIAIMLTTIFKLHNRIFVQTFGGQGCRSDVTDVEKEKRHLAAFVGDIGIKKGGPVTSSVDKLTSPDLLRRNDQCSRNCVSSLFSIRYCK